MEAIEALALVSGHVEEELLIRNEYLAMENRILKSKLKKPVQFNDSERIQLARIGKSMGLKALKEIFKDDEYVFKAFNVLGGQVVIQIR